MEQLGIGLQTVNLNSYQSKYSYRLKRRRIQIQAVRSNPAQDLQLDFSKFLYTNRGKLDQTLEADEIARRKLTSRLSHTAQPTKFLKLMTSEFDHMNSIHVSAAAINLAKICDPLRYTMQKDEKFTAYEKLLTLISIHLGQLQSREVTDCLWSLTRGAIALKIHLKDNCEEFSRVYGELCKKAVQPGFMTCAHNLSTVAWCMGKMNWQGDEYKQILQFASDADINDFNAQDISNILWSMATLGNMDRPKIAHFARIARLNVQMLSAQGIANILWALKKLRYNEHNLLIQLEQRIVKSDLVFKNSFACMVLMSLADLTCQQTKEISEIITAQFLQHYRGGHTQHISNLAYALSLLNCPVHLTQQVVDRLSELKVKKFRRQELVQLRRAQLWYESLPNSPQLKFPAQINKAALLAIQQETKSKLQIAHWFLNNVFFLAQKGFGEKNVRSRVPVHDGQLVVHVEITQNNKKVAVQVLTRAAYTLSKPIQMMGATKAYLKLLEQLGWRVVEVSAFQWYRDEYKFEVMEKISSALELDSAPTDCINTKT